MNEIDFKYKELLKDILENGIQKEDRTGVGTISVFGRQLRFNVGKNFPLLTLRKIHVKSLIHELLWFLESYDNKYKKFGNTNVKYLNDNGVSFWNEWVYEKYKTETLKKYLENDVKDDGKTVKKLKLLTIKEFENEIKNDDDFALSWGDLGPVYGHQWLKWGSYTEKVEMKKEFSMPNSKTRIVNSDGMKDITIPGINQIENIIEQLEENPDSRRLIVSAWNVSDLDDMLLAPCHCFFQFYTRILRADERNSLAGSIIDDENISFNDKENSEHHKKFDEMNIPKRAISLQLYQRSCDYMLGAPYNIASYTILLHMIAKIVNMKPEEFIYTLGDVHVYKNHIEAANEILNRESKSSPILKIDDVESINNFRYENIIIENYEPNEHIKMDIAI